MISDNIPFSSFKCLRMSLVWFLAAGILACVAHAEPARIHYHIEFLPKTQQARVKIEMSGPEWLEDARFNTQGYTLQDIQGSGTITQSDNALVWRPGGGEAELSYLVTLPRRRRSGGYDAYISEDWALLRGERMVPPVRVWRPEGAETQVQVTYYLPEAWSINTGWPRVRGNTFRIDNPDFIFPRPAGWIVAGDLTTRQETLSGGTLLLVSAPKGQNFRALELFAFLSMVWPHAQAAFETVPPKILVTGGADPLWRGGLSAPNSYYIHSDRPLVSANGTSTPIHELVHVVTGIRGKPMHNWIAEGIAEYYTIELLYRAGAYSESRKNTLFKNLENWSRNVKTLLVKNSQGRVSARAAVLFHKLDLEIRAQTKNKHTLDHLIRHLMVAKVLDLQDLQQAFKELYKVESEVLKSPLLQPRLEKPGS